MSPKCWHGGSTLCFLLFALPFLAQSCGLLSGLVLAVQVALWLVAAPVRVVQRVRAACSHADASCLLVFLACLLLKPRDYGVGQLLKGVRQPKHIKTVGSWHEGKAEAFTNAVPWLSSCICDGSMARGECGKAGAVLVKNRHAVRR